MFQKSAELRKNVPSSTAAPGMETDRLPNLHSSVTSALSYHLVTGPKTFFWFGWFSIALSRKAIETRIKPDEV